MIDISTRPQFESSRKGSHPDYLPLGVCVRGLRAVVVGGGRVGARKAKTLVEAGARVTVISPRLDDTIEALVEDGALRWLQDEYHHSYIRDADLVVAATSEGSVNQQVGEDAEQAGILYCVASAGEESRVIFPAVHREGAVTIAVHSNGTECTQSRWLRDRLATILRSEGLPPRIVAFGTYRQSLPEEHFRALQEVEDRLTPEDITGQVLILSTCQRWEAYFISDTPRTFRSQLLNLIETTGGPSLEHKLDAFDSLYDTRAVHHLLQVASGLLSPLHGETEIVGQLREAVSKWLPDSGPLRHLFAWTLSTNKRVRKQAPALKGRSWSGALEDAINRLTAGVSKPTLALIGCGSLSRAVARKVHPALKIIPFSRRKPDEVSWCSERGISVRDPSRLSRTLTSADIALIASDGPNWWLEDVSAAAGEGLTVLDVTGDHWWHDDRENCYGLTEVGSVPLIVQTAVDLSQARKAAFEASVRWHAERNSQIPLTGPLTAACRDSELSKKQTAAILDLIGEIAPDIAFELHTFDSPGDRDRDTSLTQVVEDDFFTRDLDTALLSGTADIAVHSAKDLPDRLPAGLEVAALTPAFAPWDCIVTRDNRPLSDLPAGSRVGTSSQRRREQLLNVRDDLTAVDIRGNVPERLRQLDGGRYDALVLAVAGLLRLDLQQQIAQVLPDVQFPVEPGQGALAIVIRDEDLELARLLQPLDLGNREGLPWT